MLPGRMFGKNDGHYKSDGCYAVMKSERWAGATLVAYLPGNGGFPRFAWLISALMASTRRLWPVYTMNKRARAAK